MSEMRFEVDIIHLLACDTTQPGRIVLTFQSILPPSSRSVHFYQTIRRQISEDGNLYARDVLLLSVEVLVNDDSKFKPKACTKRH
jgi:hypothetical protein